MTKAQMIDYVIAHPRHIYPNDRATLRKWTKDELAQTVRELSQ